MTKFVPFENRKIFCISKCNFTLVGNRKLFAISNNRKNLFWPSLPVGFACGFCRRALPVTCIYLNTAKSKTNGTLGYTNLLYCNFEHVPTRILKQMIYHWKALIQSSLNQEKKWAWHHPMDGHAHLTEKASLLLKSVWSLP